MCVTYLKNLCPTRINHLVEYHLLLDNHQNLMHRQVISPRKVKQLDLLGQDTSFKNGLTSRRSLRYTSVQENLNKYDRPQQEKVRQTGSELSAANGRQQVVGSKWLAAYGKHGKVWRGPFLTDSCFITIFKNQNSSGKRRSCR